MSASPDFVEGWRYWLWWLRPKIRRRGFTGWNFECGPVGVTWEKRYYRTTGLQLWLGDHMKLLWPYTPTEAENKALDDFNWRAMQRMKDGC